MSIRKKIATSFAATLFLFIFLITPVFTFAADEDYFPLCDCCNRAPDPATGAVVPCSLTDFFVVVDKIITAALYLSFFIAVIMIIKGGVHILLAAGDPGGVKKGRETVTWAIWGMVIAFGAWLIIDTVISVFTGTGIGAYLT